MNEGENLHDRRVKDDVKRHQTNLHHRLRTK